MKFVKLDKDYIDLSKVVGVSFLDDDLKICFISPGFDKYKIILRFNNKKKYLDNKRYLISELIKVSINDFGGK